MDLHSLGISDPFPNVCSFSSPDSLHHDFPPIPAFIYRHPEFPGAMEIPLEKLPLDDLDPTRRVDVHTKLLQLAAQIIRNRMHRHSPTDADVNAIADNRVARVIANNDVHRARAILRQKTRR